MKTLHITLSALTVSTLLSYAEADKYKVATKIIDTPHLTSPIQASTTLTKDELTLALAKLSEIEESHILTAPIVHLSPNKPDSIEMSNEAMLKKLNQYVSLDNGQQLSLLIDTTTAELRVKGVYKMSSINVQAADEQIELVTTTSDEVIFDAAFKLGDAVVIADKNKLIVLTISKL